MKSIAFYSILLSMLVWMSCGPQAEVSTDIGNPPAEDFNLSESDPAAIQIADEVMDAMGGRQAWEDTHYIKWTFFGRRTHLWDKTNKTVEISVPSQEMIYNLNMNDMSGEVSRSGQKYTAPDSLAFYLDQAHKMWINDSYWLVMPFKLKDSGVTLKHMGTDTTQTGALSDVLELSFSEVGVTPDNKYLVYVDQGSKLITQWDYYQNYTDSLPRFQSSWPDYKKYGKIMLSGGQIGGNKIENIEVSATQPLSL